MDDAYTYISIIIGVIGLGGVIFTALKYQRDDTTAVVGQQTQILADMKSLADEARADRDVMKLERDELRVRVTSLQAQIDELHDQIQGMLHDH